MSQLLKELFLQLRVSDAVRLQTLSADLVGSRYVDWINDVEVVKYTDQYGLSHTSDSVIEYVNISYFDSNSLLLGIFYDGIHIGNARLGSVRWAAGTCEIAYLIGDKSYWGRGVATEVVSTLVRFCFSELGLQKINSGYHAENFASGRVLEKNGFIIEGVRRRHFCCDGIYSDMVMVGKVSEP